MVCGSACGPTLQVSSISLSKSGKTGCCNFSKKKTTIETLKDYISFFRFLRYHPLSLTPLVTAFNGLLPAGDGQVLPPCCVGLSVDLYLASSWYLEALHVALHTSQWERSKAVMCVVAEMLQQQLQSGITAGRKTNYYS